MSYIVDMSRTKHARPQRKNMGGSLSFRVTEALMTRIHFAAVAAKRTTGDWVRMTVEAALDAAKVQDAR